MTPLLEKRRRAVMKYPYGTSTARMEKDHKTNKTIYMRLLSALAATVVIGLFLSATYVHGTMETVAIIITLMIAGVFGFSARKFIDIAGLAKFRLNMTIKEQAQTQVVLDSTVDIDEVKGTIRMVVNSNDEIVNHATEKFISDFTKEKKNTKDLDF